MPQSHWQPGEPAMVVPLIAGYRELVLVAQGGFSSVYTAYQDRFSRHVAIKVLHADAHDPAAFEQFQHECMMTGRLTGRPNIITVFDAGVTADRRPYIAMQYLPNGSLADRLAASGPLPTSEILHIGGAMAGALDAAHRAGILHRDVKPANILVSDEGQPVLTDFGIASLAGPASWANTPQAFTFSHAAPEILAGQPASVRSDLYALGSTLFTLFVGTPPFGTYAGSLPAERLAQIQAGGPGEVDRITANRPDVPASVVALLRRTLALDPTQRPVSAAELAAGLADAAKPVVRRNRRRAVLIAGAVAVLAIAAVGGTLLFRRDGTPGAQPPASRAADPGSAAGGPAQFSTTMATSTSTTPTTTATATTAPTSAQPTTGTHPQQPPPPPPSPTTVPPVSTTTNGVYYVYGEDVLLDQSSGHGCKAWLNGRNPGPDVQGLVESWGDACLVVLWRSTDGGRTFNSIGGQHVLSTGTASTTFYPDGSGSLIKACLTDRAASQTICDQPYGPS